MFFSGGGGGGGGVNNGRYRHNSFPNKQLSAVTARCLSKVSPTAGRRVSAGISIRGLAADVGAHIFSLFPRGTGPELPNVLKCKQQTNSHICLATCLHSPLYLEDMMTSCRNRTSRCQTPYLSIAPTPPVSLLLFVCVCGGVCVMLCTL